MAELAGDRIIGIEEKPERPKTNLAVTGIYMYDSSVFDKCRQLTPSRRNELEITDVNNAYIREGTMTFNYLSRWWTDAGTFDSLRRATNLVADTRAGAPPFMSSVAAALQPSSGSHSPTQRASARSFSSRNRLISSQAYAFNRFLSFPMTALLLRSLPPRRRSRRQFPANSTQVSSALSYPGTIKAFHYHRHQTDLWVPAQSMLQVSLVDLRADSPTHGVRNTLYVGQLRPWQILIPPASAHGYKCHWATAAMLVYVHNRHYNPGRRRAHPA